MKFDVIAVDAFTGPGCLGNIAGVCTPPPEANEKEMQEVARSFGAPETAFIFKDAHKIDIRWFTPEMEVDLCGHATLAASAWLWALEKPLAHATITFHSKSGALECTRTEEGLIELHFPELPSAEAAPEPGLLDALKINEPLFIGKSGDYFLIEVPMESDVAQLAPDFD